jgi:DNA-binding response OmpR family regulator
MSQRRVLLVDDDRDIVQMLTGVLRKAGYEVIAALDALQGVSQAQRNQPDVILLDLVMPAGGGFSVLQRLKALARTNTIPVIVLTGSVEPGIEAKARELGAQGFFHKPYDVAAVLDAIRQVLAEPGPAG